MKSNHYAKTPGAGVSPNSENPSESAVTLSPCRHINGKGHHCSMFTTDPPSGLCSHHARQQVTRQRKQTAAVAKALIGGLDDFTSPDAVTTFLSNLLREVIHKRIDRRDAATMAYISQLLLAGQAAFQRFADADLNARGTDPLVETLKAQIQAQSAKHGEPEQN